MRTTIARPFIVRGRGLHTGVAVDVTVHPAESDHGLVFFRSDVGGHNALPATLDLVTSTTRRTELGNGTTTLGTVEHILAALSAEQIDDVVVRVHGPELPQLDGSARPFVELLRQAGVTRREGARRRYDIVRRFEVSHQSATYTVDPAPVLELDVTIEWQHPAIGVQSYQSVVSPTAFRTDIAGARTFGFLKELGALRGMGLAAGATPHSLVALSEDAIVHGLPLRWPDEFVRHKMLDLIGDLALLGGQLAAKIRAHRPSHAGNVALARAIREHGNEVVVAHEAVANGFT